MADHSSTFLLRRFIGAIGYRVWGWGQGLNRGLMLDHLPGITARVAELAAAHD